MKMSSHNQLYSRIKKLPCFDHSVVIERIKAGQSSDCFKVTTLLDEKQVKKYFVKYDDNADFFDNELRTSKEASLIDLSPRVIYSNNNWLVNEFIEGVTLNHSLLTNKEKIEIALNLIKRCDILTVSLPTLNVKAIIDNIMLNTCFSSQQCEYVQRTLHKLPSIEVKELLVCHGDVNFSNIIVDKDNAWLIDFECTCLAEKEFELAMFFAINLLSANEQLYALNTYERISQKVKVDTHKLSFYLLYSYLINGLWYLEKTKEEKLSELKNKTFYNLAFEQFSLFDSMYESEVSLSTIMR